MTLLGPSLVLAGLVLTVLLLRAVARVCTASMARALALRAGRVGAHASVRAIATWGQRRAPGLFGVLHRRLRPDVFTGLPLTLMAVAALYLAALLGGLTEEVVEAQGMLRIDRAINAAFAPWRDARLVGVFLWITALGAGPALAAVAITATAFLWSSSRSVLILPLWVALAGAQVTTWVGKYAIDRHRPDFIAAVTATSPSFPSGHATGAMAIYGFLAYAIARDLGGWGQRFEVAYWTAALIVLIGFSRIFLSVHYASDVVGGFMVGAFWLLVGFAIAEYRRHVRKP